MEAIYFRQNIRGSKNQPCQYPGCWENTLFNNKSSYCPLHQKVMRNTTIDLFNTFSQKMQSQEWELFTSELIKKEYKVTLRDLSQLLLNFTNKELSRRQMTNIYETYKVHRNAEDNPEEVEDRLVNVKDLVSTRLTRKMKRVDDLIAIQ